MNLRIAPRAQLRRRVLGDEYLGLALRSALGYLLAPRLELSNPARKPTHHARYENAYVMRSMRAVKDDSRFTGGQRRTANRA